MTICIQCLMRALVKDEPPPVFDESPEEHQRRCHADLKATQKERRTLEAQLLAKITKEKLR